MKIQLLKKIKLSKKQKIIAGSVIALVLLIVILKIARTAVEKSSASSQTTYVVRKETYENVIEIAGTVDAAKEQTLESLNDGTVVGVYKKEGDAVKKGDLIVQLDDTEQQYNLANLDYEISVAKQNQTAGKIKLMETQRLSLVSKVSDRKIVATFDGIIAELDVDPGDYLEAKDEIGTLVNTSYLTADVEVAETDVSKLQAGQKVEFTFPAYDGTVEGYLVSYPAIGEVTSRGATVVNAKVRIDDVPEGILPNFSFTGKIQITEPETKLVVERYAIGHEKGTAFVEILGRDGKTTKVEVEVQPYGTDYVNIISGLEGGEMLKAQSSASKSGRMSVTKKGEKAQKNKNNQQQGGMMGAGGPPPF
ncbi:efflux RND transporter periplasmic adaptor subunit [Treponema sp.]|uniref:efflux RND transporter periplasmic adaptor subunit n=1 Tax=Treponema sp. TaxID=166 RepID=UPI00388D457C